MSNKTLHITIAIIMIILFIGLYGMYRQDQEIEELKAENENWQVEWKRKALENFELDIRLDEIRKYNPFQKALSKIAKNDYSEDYNCYEFTKDLQQELIKLDIWSLIAINKDRNHAFLLVPIETAKGIFIGIDNDYEIMEIRDSDLEVIYGCYDLVGEMIKCPEMK